MAVRRPSRAAPFTLARRHLLGGLGALVAAPHLAWARSPSDLAMAQLRTGGTWNARPDALRRLAWELRQRTSIEVDLEPKVVELEQTQLFRYPFLYWSGSGPHPVPDENTLRVLRRHLTYGGSLLIDSADAEPGGAFDSSVRETLQALFPRQSLERIPNDHVLFKTFYLVDTQAGRVLRVPYLEGLALEDRYAVVYCQNDLAGAWSRDAFGRWSFDVSPGGDRQREMAFRLGINVVMYFLCLDYKDDLVHTPFILDRRR
ncbi:MAG: DUF4159 domain-containing protein [Myxococcota bacterium]